MTHSDVNGSDRAPNQGTGILLELFAALIGNTRDGIVFEANDRSVQLVNQRLCDLLGIAVSPQAFHGQSSSVLAGHATVTFPEHERFLNRVEEIVRAAQVVTDEELVLRDGKILERDYAPVVAADGTLLGHVWQYRDVSERKNAENTLRETEAQLRQSQKLEAVGRLAAGISHDFNNLLMVIIGYCELLGGRLDDRTAVKNGIEQIWNATERASALARHLLAFSRKQDLESKVLNPNDLIRKVGSILEVLVREDVEIVHALQPRLGQVEADPAQLEHMLLNLVVNACDAMPHGGKIVIETADVDLDDAYVERHVGVRAGSYVRLSVSDTGSGMDKAVQGHIFEPFFTTKDEQGTGLGLSTAYGIVKQCGGNIWVYSEPGMGTTFKIYLPRVQKVQEVSIGRVTPTELPAGTETLLLVEDEQVVRDLVRTVLQADGYAVLEAERPLDAVRICERHDGPIHLLITDVVMPQMNGRELSEQVKALHDETKTLYMSGYSAEALATQGVLEPGTALLEKPVSPRIVARRVREILRGEKPKGARRARPLKGTTGSEHLEQP